MIVEHSDVQLALLFSTQVCWTIEDVIQLRALVKRNEVVGSPLGREGYITMRDLWFAVEPFVRQREVTRAGLLAIMKPRSKRLKKTEETIRIEAEEKAAREFKKRYHELLAGLST